MKHTVIIDGGAGRVIAAIPALERFVEKYPDTNIICHYWTPLLYNNRKLQHLVYDDLTKGLFNLIKDTKIIKPEPYYNTNYMNGRVSLIEAFNEELNGISNFTKPELPLTAGEIQSTSTTFNLFTEKRRTIIVHPFGSGAVCLGEELKDDTSRSLSVKHTKSLINHLSKLGNIIVLTHSAFEHHFKELPCVYVNETPGIRYWAALVHQSHYMVGVDSVVQHMAYCYEKPGSIILGSTNAKNVTYPEWFTIFEREDIVKEYVPMRTCQTDFYLSNLINSEFMNFSDEDMLDIAKAIEQEIHTLPV